MEESAQTDNTGKIVNGMNGLNLADMTFHEVNSWKEQEIVKQLHIASDSIGLKPHCSIARSSIGLKPLCSTGDKEDQPTAGWVWRCWRLSPTCRPPPPAWIQGCQLDQQKLVSNLISKGFCQKKHQHHTNQHQHRHQQQPPPPAWLQSKQPTYRERLISKLNINTTLINIDINNQEKLVSKQYDLRCLKGLMVKQGRSYLRLATSWIE